MNNSTNSSSDINVNVLVQDSNKPVEIHVHHFHHPPSNGKGKERSGSQVPQAGLRSLVPAAAAPAVAAEAKKSLPLVDGSTVRLRTDSGLGGDGCFLGVDESGKVVHNLPKNNAKTLFKVRARGASADGEEKFSLLSVTGKALRVNQKGLVDCEGGSGHWTFFQCVPSGSGIALKSISNQGKENTCGSQDWFVGVCDNAVIGNSSPYAFRVEEVAQAPAPKAGPKLTAEEREARQKAKEARGPKLTAEEREARQKAKKEEIEARQKAKAELIEARQKAKREMIEAKKAAIAQKKAEKNNNNNNNNKPALSPEERKQRREANRKFVHEAFPAGKAIFLSPARFAEHQNRKAGMGWNLGISTQGFIVPDASTGAWGRLRAVEGEGGVVFLEASHSSFRIAVTKDRQLSTQGKDGKFAQFVPTKIGAKFWSLKCVGHKETPAFLGVSECGLVYVASEESKDTKFLVSIPASPSPANGEE